VQAGGGVVADSVPADEHQESVNKSMAVLRAVAAATGLRSAVGSGVRSVSP
jgi:anthranilate synthase component 1